MLHLLASCALLLPAHSLSGKMLHYQGIVILPDWHSRCSAIAQHRTVIDYPHRCNSQRQVIRDALLALLNDACVCADIMPVYHLGDSQLFNFVGFKWLSRKLRASLGVIWGRWGLPLPRQHDLIALVDYPISGTY